MPVVAAMTVTTHASDAMVAIPFWLEMFAVVAASISGVLVAREHKLDLVRWREALELAVFDYFDIDALLSYLVRVNIVARWSRLDPARGRELFARLVEGLDARQLIENKQ